MSLLSLYVARQVFVTTLVITAAMVALAVLARTLRVVEMVVNEGLSFQSFLLMLALLVPSMVQVILPVALMIACLFTLNKMQSDNEMMVVHTTGLHPFRIRLPIYVVTLIYGGFLLLNGTVLQPFAYTKIEDIKSRLATTFAVSVLEAQTFIDLSHKRTLYYESVSNGQMHHIVIRDETDPNFPSTTFALRGQFKETTDKSFLLLKDVEQVGTRGEDKTPYRLKSVSQTILITDLQDTKAREQRIKEMGFEELLSAYRAVERGNARNKISKYLHEALSAPLHMLALIVLVANFMLISNHNRSGNSSRVTLAAGFFSLFTILDIVAENRVGKNEHNWWMIYAFILAALLSAWALPKLLRKG